MYTVCIQRVMCTGSVCTVCVRAVHTECELTGSKKDDKEPGDDQVKVQKGNHRDWGHGRHGLIYIAFCFRSSVNTPLARL